jgi:hypothetical protein
MVLPLTIRNLVRGQGARDATYMAWPMLWRGVALVRSRVVLARRRAAERRKPQALDGRLRRDAGIGPLEVRALARRSLWHA